MMLLSSLVTLLLWLSYGKKQAAFLFPVVQTLLRAVFGAKSSLKLVGNYFGN
jgi:hypothetical protein